LLGSFGQRTQRFVFPQVETYQIHQGLAFKRSDHRSVIRLERINGEFEYRGPAALRKYLCLTARSFLNQDRSSDGIYLRVAEELKLMASDQLQVEIEPASPAME
jgi:hypothetical protein